jgi:hypothetical protein
MMKPGKLKNREDIVPGALHLRPTWRVRCASAARRSRDARQSSAMAQDSDLPGIPQAAAVLRSRARISVVWVIPVLAAAVALEIAVQRVLSESPTIHGQSGSDDKIYQTVAKCSPHFV